MKNSSFDKLLCAICYEHFYFQKRTQYIFTPVAIYVLVLLSRKESHISIYVSVWAVIRLESNILLGGFKVHVTYILNAITGNIYIGNINSGNFCLRVTLSSLSSLCNH